MNMPLKYVKVAGIGAHAGFILIAYRAYGKIKLTEFPNTTGGIAQATRFMLKQSIKLAVWNLPDAITAAFISR